MRRKWLAAALALAGAAVLFAVLYVRWDVGPDGWVVWMWPPHVSAGFGWVHGHVTGWWETA